MKPEDSLMEVKGIGEKLYRLYNRLDLYTAGDLLSYYPRAYAEFPEPLSKISDDLKDGEKAALLITPHEVCKTRRTRRMEITTLSAFCGATPVDMIWFRSPFVRSQVKMHVPCIFYGIIKREGFLVKMEQPVIYTTEKYNKERSSLQPVYSLTKGLTNNQIKKNLRQVLDEVAEEEFLPQEYLKKRHLSSRTFSLRQIHFPDTFDTLGEARNRLVYEEFFTFLLEMELSKEEISKVKNPFSFSKDACYEKVRKNLPFALTEGQQQALSDVREDFGGAYVSQRLIQGDVGSGKTILAFLLMVNVLENGYQAAIMAPTEILATQHYQTFCEYIKRYDLPFSAVLLTGSKTAKQKREVYERLSSGEPLFVIGTNALIQEKANYENLALVITDEQHRFGVKQRKTFTEKGLHPFAIVMSATPIPRTLSMILYGDMNISVISDVPARRLPIKNAVIKDDKRDSAYQFIAKQIKEGHQAYIICPLVEASETTEAENVTDYGENIKKLFGTAAQIGILHGRMKPEEKNAVMESFLKNDTQILVSTTVVEVGVNVPNATVMMIENANRFGLAQLHQLRGRVGRGDAQSYCIFMDASKEGTPSKRLEVISGSNDGFYIASEDLKLRGPGDFYGIRQSGDLDFALADIYQDADMMQNASVDVKELLANDPDLTEHPALASYLAARRDRQYTNL